MLDTQNPFTTMTIADVCDTATPEEAAMLRSDENLEAWLEELVNYVRELDLEVKRRKAACFRFQTQTKSRAKVSNLFAESMEFEVQATERKMQAKRRMDEAHQLMRGRKEKAKNGAGGESHIERYKEARLHDVKRFLEIDAYFKEEFLPVKEKLLQDVSGLLEKCGGER